MDADWFGWLQRREAYAVLVLVLLAIGLALALGRRRRSKPAPPSARSPLPPSHHELKNRRRR